MTKGLDRVWALAGVVLLWAGLVAAEPPSEEGLAAYWDFDEPSGARAVDRAGGDNDGTLGGTPAAQRVEGPFGSPSLRFTAPLQEVTGPDAGLPVGSSPGSMIPLPQVEEQSKSLVASQPAGQQSSASLQMLTTE